MLSINTNLSSIIAQRSMKQSTNSLNQAIERMTTGAKINHAKDNAANYSIATNMDTKIGALQVAEDNVAMSLDMILTTNGALDLIYDKLQKLRSLAVQAGNGTYGTKSQEAINAEAKALVDEISRIKTNTKYNDIELLAPMSDNLTPPYSYTPNSDGFLADVEKRDTTSMGAFAGIDENTDLISGQYTIATAEDLAKLARMTNNGRIGSACEFVLVADIDLSSYSTGEGWTPIGNSYYRPFTASFDGNGYKISNLYINANVTISTTDYLGLFGSVENTIKNVGIINANVNYDKNVNQCSVGTLAGNVTKGDIINCYATGSVTGREFDYVGGLVGTTFVVDSYRVSAEDCWTNVNVKGTGVNHDHNSSGCVGGIFGKAPANISRCFSTGDVYAPDLCCVGGVAGDFSVSNYEIYNSYSTGDITGYFRVGGLAGDAGSCIDNCYSIGSITGEKWVGGLAGGSGSLNDFVINSSGVYGKVSGTQYAGALLGASHNAVFLTNNVYCDSTNDITGNGLYGQNENNTNLAINIAMSEKVFQIGINSGDSNNISYSIGFSFGNLEEILTQGLHNSMAIGTIDKFITQVSEKQTELGAVQNRLESALDEISTQYENLVSSRSTLRDADIAEVSSTYIKQQILQQASATLLATANQSPSIALQLI